MIISLRLIFISNVSLNGNAQYFFGMFKASVAIIVPLLLIINIMLIFGDFLAQYKFHLDSNLRNRNKKLHL